MTRIPALGFLISQGGRERGPQMISIFHKTIFYSSQLSQSTCSSNPLTLRKNFAPLARLLERLAATPTPPGLVGPRLRYFPSRLLYGKLSSKSFSFGYMSTKSSPSHFFLKDMSAKVINANKNRVCEKYEDSPVETVNTVWFVFRQKSFSFWPNRNVGNDN